MSIGGGGKGGRSLGLTTLPPSCADYLGTVGVSLLDAKGLSRPVRGLLSVSDVGHECTVAAVLMCPDLLVCFKVFELDLYNYQLTAVMPTRITCLPGRLPV
jgi:hypothetical protein